MRYVGINYIRIRIWNDPFDSEGHGYGGGNNDIETAVKIGKRATKYGMKILASYHYSDFYADPGSQNVPKALVGLTLEEKAQKAEEFTKETLTRFKNEASQQILKANEADFKKAFEGLRNSKDKFIAELQKRIDETNHYSGTVCHRTELIERAQALYAERPERCEPFALDIEEWLEKLEQIRTDSVWQTVIAGNQDIDIAALIDELCNSSWVNQGRSFLRRGSKTCPFCQKETITDDFRLKLEAFFDSEYKSHVEAMERLLKDYKEAADHISTRFDEATNNERAVTIGKLDANLYVAKNSLLNTAFKEYEKIIEEKIKEPGKKITLPDISVQIREIQSLLASANGLIENHNKLVDERDTEEKALTDDVWATVIDDANSLIKTYKTEINKLK